MAHVDLEKAFDEVQWNKIFQILKSTELIREMRFIYKLYVN